VAKQRKLVTSAEAKPRKTQHKKPCSDCPWARASLNGWLGGLSIEDWLARAKSDENVECHTAGNQQCAGLAIFRRHICKSPRDPAVLRLEADREKVFANPQEFSDHHSQRPKERHGNS